MELTGAGKIVYGVDESASVILNPTQGGIAMIQGPTLIGEIGKAVFIANWPAFVRNFGSHHPVSMFPTYMKIMLDAGAKFWVTRAFHFTDIDDVDTVTGTKASGTLTVDTDVNNWAAIAVGEGYNGATITTSAARSGDAARIDVLVTLPGGDVTERLENVKRVLTVDEIAAVNEKLKFVQLATVTGELVVGTATLAGGVQDTTEIVSDDYKGSAIARNGLYSFSKASNAFRLVNWKADPLIDIAYADFAKTTMRVKAELGVPVGATAEGMNEYRMGEGAYDHTPVNTWLATFTYGDLSVPDPRDGKLRIQIPGVVAVIANKLVKDASGSPWLSAAILPEYGIVRSANFGVEYDLNAPENQANYDLLSANGANAITNDETFGVVYHGNDSALLDRTSVLRDENTADLVLYVLRNLPQYIRTSQFRPNDPQMWENLYLKVRPSIDVLVNGRAIRPVEGRDWFWIGDQDVDDYRDAVYNTVADIDAGKYKARFVFVGVTAAKYIGIDFVPTDSNSIATIVRDDINV